MAGQSWRGITAHMSLSRVQSLVATVAGIVSIAGALLSLSPLGHALTAGQLVATVQDAGSHRGMSDATIEVLTTENHLVATLTPDAVGRASQSLTEGVYVVRISHPRYAPELRRVQVAPRQTVEIHAILHTASSSSPADRAVTSGVRAVRKALRF